MNIQRIFRAAHQVRFQMSAKHRFSLAMNREIVCFPSIQDEKLHSFKRTMAIHQTDTVNEPGFLRKFLKSIPFLKLDKTKLKLIAYEHYESVVDGIDYYQFFYDLDIPDTFYSWFAITELHLWMLSVRAMAEGDDGRLIRNNIIEALWADVFPRIKELGEVISQVEAREKITELSEQLQATLIAYDEGIQGQDITLASALWRRLYQQKEVNVEHLHMLIKYIRKHMRILDGLSKEEFFNPKNIKWHPLNS
ncbi:hypothetical protein WA026_007268 [Henosepilachna vigintioctopunctata]|uniref:Ubiquinol-cytochrome c chaperone domain-containing protein n=1 Tax=Henosepilachna vigintioctopunctata TaxID=420089 RepID=A0AAW1UUG1_9CUCU